MYKDETMMVSLIGKKIVAWYRHNQRDLPWREQRDGYAVWVSEIMLQQTRVETVRGYYEGWMRRFPTIEVLAAASQQDVLTEWEGLGYYSRARNIHRAAKEVVEKYDGRLPENVIDLKALPGIGKYTAGAIASIAFGVDEAVVDGNIKRALARLFNVEHSVDTSKGERRIWALAREHLPPGQASDYNQGLMDLGARICTARNPNCDECPLKEDCQAYAIGNQEQRPVRNPKPARPHHRLAAAVIQKGSNVLVRQRDENGLLGGMWEFPNYKTSAGDNGVAELAQCVWNDLGVRIKAGEQVGEFEHGYTHFRVTVRAFECALVGNNGRMTEQQALKWVNVDDLDEYPMGKVDRLISQSIVEIKN